VSAAVNTESKRKEKMVRRKKLR